MPLNDPAGVPDGLSWANRDEHYEDMERMTLACLQLMGISEHEYRVRVDCRRLDEGNLAETRMLTHNKDAVIWYDLDQLGMKVEDSARAVLHEVSHLLLFPYEMVQNAVAAFFADHELVGQGMYESLWKNACERSTDNIARVLSNGMLGANMLTMLAQYTQPYQRSRPVKPPFWEDSGEPVMSFRGSSEEVAND